MVNYLHAQYTMMYYICHTFLQQYFLPNISLTPKKFLLHFHFSGVQISGAAQRLHRILPGGVKDMECGQVQEKLSCYLDGVLDEATLEAIEAHLEVCEACRAELTALETVVGLTSDLSDVAPPAYLSFAIKDAIAKEQEAAGACGKYAVMLSEYIDNMLEAEDERELKAHLAACSNCAKELEMLRATVASMAMVAEVDPPASLRSRIAAATTGTKRTSVLQTIIQQLGYVFQTPRVGWAVAATAAVVAGIWLALPYDIGKKPEVKITPIHPKAVVEAPEIKPLDDLAADTTLVKESEPAPTVTHHKRMKVASVQKTVQADAHSAETNNKPVKHIGDSSANPPDTQEKPVETEIEVAQELDEDRFIDDNTDENIEIGTPEQPKETIIRITKKPQPIVEDISDDFKDIKVIAKMKRKSNDKLKVEVISTKF